jgi:hypothetical protein
MSRFEEYLDRLYAERIDEYQAQFIEDSQLAVRRKREVMVSALAVAATTSATAVNDFVIEYLPHSIEKYAPVAMAFAASSLISDIIGTRYHRNRANRIANRAIAYAEHCDHEHPTWAVPFANDSEVQQISDALQNPWSQ